ncbi:MAG: FAD-binding monooxygenase, partial [Thermoproteota archaeon]|nr:FAD-binding monooxygenase [Thermoproteota archaeon]
ELDKLLSESIAESALAKTYFKRILKIIDNIWQMSTGEDFRYPETIGKRPLGIDLINKYVARVHRATIKDEVVCGTFLKVMGLLEPPTKLMQPNIMWRVFKAT